MEKTWDLYGFLGLPRSASRDEVARRCEELLNWLESDAIPDELRPWTSSQRALVEDLYESLEPEEEDAGDEVEEVALRLRGGPRSGRKVTAFLSSVAGKPLVLGLLGMAVGAALLTGILWWRGVSFGGGKEDVGASAAQDASSPARYLASQQERIAELERAVATNPHDTGALFELGETYMVGQSWEQAILWFERLLAVDPDNLHARTDVGTANMNLGRYSEAEAAFTQVLEAAPDDVQAHYNMGFLSAFRSDAPDLAAAVKHWEEVVRLAPDSPLAEVAQIHLDQFQSIDRGP